MPRKVYSTGPRCPHCGKKPESPKKSLCNKCSAAYMREYRKTHRLTGEARKRANARSYLHQAIKRCHMVKLPCQVCGGLEVEAHHTDYDKPLEVVWLCRGKHLEISGSVERVKVLYRIKAIQPQPGDCFSAGDL